MTALADMFMAACIRAVTNKQSKACNWPLHYASFAITAKHASVKCCTQSSTLASPTGVLHQSGRCTRGGPTCC